MTEFNKLSVQDDDKAIFMAKPDTTGFANMPGGTVTPPRVPTSVSIRDIKVTTVTGPRVGVVRDTIMYCW